MTRKEAKKKSYGTKPTRPPTSETTKAFGWFMLGLMLGAFLTQIFVIWYRN